jgi:ribosome-associated protein
MMSPQEVALTAAKALDDKKGMDIKLLKVSDVTILADHFLICTGTSNTHVKTLCDEVEKVMDEAGEELLHREGHRSGTWVLLDFGCLVVHVFTDETRKFYDLERLWNDATPVPLNFGTEA